MTMVAVMMMMVAVVMVGMVEIGDRVWRPLQCRISKYAANDMANM